MNVVNGSRLSVPLIPHREVEHDLPDEPNYLNTPIQHGTGTITQLTEPEKRVRVKRKKYPFGFRLPEESE